MPVVKWTRELIKETAKKFQTKTDFKNAFGGAVEAAHRYGDDFYKECTAHMTPVPNCFTHDIGIVYVYVSKNIAYVGSTVVPTLRKNDHAIRGPVHAYTQKGHHFEYIVLEKHIKFEHIIEREQYYMDMYANKGFQMLNSVKASSRGCITVHRWNIPNIKKEILKYKTLKEWRRNSPTSYSAALKYGCFTELSHNLIRETTVWCDNEAILENAKQYNTKRDWRASKGSSYNAAVNRNIVPLCTEHMIALRPVVSLDEIHTEVKKYTNTTDWIAGSERTYLAAIRLKIFDQITKHFIPKIRSWTDQQLLDKSAEYKDASEWRNKDRNSYVIAYKRKLVSIK